MNRVRTDILEIAFEEGGPSNGIPILLLHGFFGATATLAGVTAWSLMAQRRLWSYHPRAIQFRHNFNQEDPYNMRRTYVFALALLVVILVPTASFSQGGQMETSRGVAGGGVSVPGWTGKIDAKEEAAGMTLNSAKLVKDGDAFHVTTGPAVTYWNPANKASGDYTVKATFKEPKYMNLNSHPHPYGIVIAGNDLGTDQQSYLYCAAYGNGNFIVRGFGPTPFQMNGRGGPDPAVNKAAGVGEPVTQEIAISVRGDKVECAINNKVVASYDKSALVTAGKLKSTDGVYGFRFAHNTEGFVTGLTITKP